MLLRIAPAGPNDVAAARQGFGNFDQSPLHGRELR
jgi:hypothetical protein